MNSSEIDLLIERYLDGATSLADEESLRDFFSREGIPEKYQVYASMFKGMQSLKNEQISDRHFAKRIIQKIDKSDTRKPRKSLSFSWYLVSGVAATVILAVLLFVPVRKYPVLNIFSDKIADTFDDPQKAYTETIKVLLMVSSKINTGTNQMKGLGKFEDGMEDAGKMLTFNRGIQEAGALNKLQENAGPLRKFEKMDKGMEDARRLLKFDKDQFNSNNL